MKNFTIKKLNSKTKNSLKKMRLILLNIKYFLTKKCKNYKKFQINKRYNFIILKSS